MSTASPRFTTARKLITRALRRITIISETETPSDAQMADGFEDLCSMLSNWRTKPHTQHGIRRHIFTGLRAVDEPGAARPHLILTDTDLITGPHVIRFSIRPTWILGISWLPTSTTERPLIEIPVSTWTGSQAINLGRTYEDLNNEIRVTASGDPQLYFFDSDYSEVQDGQGESKLIGAGRLYLVPSPPGEFSLAINARRSVLEFENLDDEVSLPDGYEPAIRFNLARWLAGEYGRAVDRELQMMADNTLRDVKAVQEARPDTVSPEPIFTAERARIRNTLYQR